MPKLPSPPDAPAPFAADFERAAQEVRGALIDLFAAAGAAPDAPQALARRFGLNKNLAWKACKIVNATDPYALVQHLPGPAGCEILVGAFSTAEPAVPTVIDRAREAFEGFEAMVARHAGNRAALARMLGSMRPDRVDEALVESGRRSAFEGNSAMFGVQARVRAGLHAIAPSRELDGRLDVAIVGELADFRRLRPGATWQLTQEQHASDDPDGGPRRVEPIDPDVKAGEPPLLRAFCTDVESSIRAVPTPDGTIYELCEGPVGNTAAASYAFGWVLRGFGSMYRTDEDSVGEYFLRSNTPSERLLFDVLVHRDLPWHGAPELDFVSALQGRVEAPFTANARFLLPKLARVESLGSGPPVVSSPALPHRSELVRAAVERLGSRLEEFRGYRLDLTYPPIPTFAVFHYALPERPESD